MSPTGAIILAALLSFCGNFILWYLNKKNSAVTQGKISELHLLVNSRLTQLIEAKGAEAHAAGMAEERDRVPVAGSTEAIKGK